MQVFAVNRVSGRIGWNRLQCRDGDGASGGIGVSGSVGGLAWRSGDLDPNVLCHVPHAPPRRAAPNLRDNCLLGSLHIERVGRAFCIPDFAHKAST